MHSSEGQNLYVRDKIQKRGMTSLIGNELLNDQPVPAFVYRGYRTALLPFLRRGIRPLFVVGVGGFGPPIPAVFSANL